MKKKLISAFVAAALAASTCTGFITPVYALAGKKPKYQDQARKMEKIGRGLIAAYRTADNKNVMSDEAGVYLSWRLLGDESLETQEFDIYRNDTKIATTAGAGATNYIDASGKTTDTYKVVKAGAGDDAVAAEKAAVPQTNHVGGGGSALKQSFIYEDIRLEMPADSNGGSYYTIDKDHEGGANDAAIGDLDGDGEYEIVLKWDPTNSKDASSGGEAGRMYLDGYEIDPTNTDPTKNDNGHLYKWRLDMGPHVRSGAHETPFLVYDFDGDGKSEIVSLSGPGAVDGTGAYVTEVGDTDTIKNADNTLVQLRKGKNIGPEYYTVFDGKTGKALCTTDAIPLGREDGGDWGDSKMQRSPRYLAGVAYLDGVHPSIVMCRGYYNRAAIRAYIWNGEEMILQWEYDGKSAGVNSLYGQGNHNLSIADIDNDGKDEIVYGSACLDDDGTTVLGNTQLGHGDAMHVNDFNNDGVQEVFSVKEKKEGYSKYAEDLRVAATGEHFWEEGKLAASGDNGRGVMANIDDEYAKTHENALAIGWSSGFANAHDLNGNDLKAKPASAGKGSFDNFLVYWDGDLSRELLDANIIQKYDAENGWSTRFWGENDGYTLTGGVTNNYTKRNPSLVADLWGDWREEIIMPTGKGDGEIPTLRIFTSTLPTDYRLATLMHDSQYRVAIAWQNIAYNQPPHTSYYIGSAALAMDGSGDTLNYLAPAVKYTKVTYDRPANVPVTGVTLSKDSVELERGKTQTVTAAVVPDAAIKKSVIWSSSDEKVATVSKGTIKGIGVGTATITATTKEGGFTAECTVTVYSNPVTGISLSETSIELGSGYSEKLDVNVTPSTASDKSVIWSSEDEGIAKVSSDGTVTGAGYGTTVITATTNDGGLKAKCIVKVKPIDVVDKTGTNEFDFAQENTDANTTITASATSASISQKDASAGTVITKDFEPASSGSAKLDFRFTTGGQRIDGSNWNWTGHEYTLGLRFLDTAGNNILDISQAWTSKAQATMGKIMSENAANISGWTKTVADGENPLARSTTRWCVSLDFDYDAGICKATLSGATAEWAKGVTYEKTFNLDGASFKTMQVYTTKDGSGTVTVTPSLERVSYSASTSVTGTAEQLYSKNGASDDWTQTDIEGWTQTGTDTASLSIDDETGCIVYKPVAPAGEYSAEKKFDGLKAGALVTYDVDWYFGNAVARDGNFEYLQFGDNLRIGWTNGYKTFISTDGGTTWLDSNGDGTPDSIFDGANALYTKNVRAVFNTTTGNVTLWFDNNRVGEYQYRMTDAITTESADSVKFGFTRGGAAPAWEVPNGIAGISVSQFMVGEETVDFSYLTKTGTDGNAVNVSYAVAGDADKITIIGALYADGALVEVKTKDVSESEHNKELTESITFDESMENRTVKLFMWDSAEGMIPLCEYNN